MKLKLDLHPIFNDSRNIEDALFAIIDDAVAKKASEIEIIPGKGSGALKKSVLRFLERPEIKARYHRLEKDGDNWGRLFVHFRHDRTESAKGPASDPVKLIAAACACCGEQISSPEPDDESKTSISSTCPWCGSPNRLRLRRDRKGVIHATAELNYDSATGP